MVGSHKALSWYYWPAQI